MWLGSKGPTGSRESGTHLLPLEVNANFTQVDRYVMHQLYELEQTALSSYAQYNFPKGNTAPPLQELAFDQGPPPVISTLSNFTNTTLSSLYFDITKDNLYANSLFSLERRSTVTVLQHVR
jgi:isoleucyl-tRNA synthetase